MNINIDFDGNLDARGKDPDSHSPTLRKNHQVCWSKELPCGKVFTLDITGPAPFLVHRSELGEFYLTSDSITHRYASRPQVLPLIPHLPPEVRAIVDDADWSISRCILFPGKIVDRKPTINGARGMHPWIGDRFDLTLECIRLHYLAKPSPLSEALARYSSFFALFVDFKGYTDFFLLQDHLVEPGGAVKFYLPFNGFGPSPVPSDLESYIRYLLNVQEFVTGRRARLHQYIKGLA